MAEEAGDGAGIGGWFLVGGEGVEEVGDELAEVVGARGGRAGGFDGVAKDGAGIADPLAALVGAAAADEEVVGGDAIAEGLPDVGEGAVDGGSRLVGEVGLGEGLELLDVPGDLGEHAEVIVGGVEEIRG